MIDAELALVRQHPEWLRVLQTYQEAHQQLQNRQPETVREEHLEDEPPAEEIENDAADSDTPRRTQPWLPRVTRVDGMSSEELSRIHGRLIAYGLLKCDFEAHSAGIVYQLTLAARQALNEHSKVADSEAAA